MIAIKDNDNNIRRGYINATDIQLLDIEDKFKHKNLEDALKEVGSGTEQNMLRIEDKVDKLDKDKTNILKTIGNVNVETDGDIASQLKDCAKNIVNINTNGVKKLIQGEILADLDNFLELNTIKSISDITANKPNGVDFASVINLGMQGNNFNQIIADRQGKIFCRGYALWDTPKFKKWQQLATTEKVDELFGGDYTTVKDEVINLTFNITDYNKLIFTTGTGISRTWNTVLTPSFRYPNTFLIGDYIGGTTIGLDFTVKPFSFTVVSNNQLKVIDGDIRIREIKGVI